MINVGEPGTEDDAMSATTTQSRSTDQRPVHREPPASVPAFPDRQRWLGFSVHDSPEQIREFCDYANVVFDASWAEDGDAMLQAARKHGLKVVLLTFDDWRDRTERQLLPLVEANGDVVVGVCWERPYYNGNTPSDVEAFAKQVHDRIPGLGVWVSLLPGRPALTMQVPDEVDGILLFFEGCATERDIRQRAKSRFPTWLSKAAGRPLLLRWKNSVRACDPSSIRACGDVVEEWGLRGAIFTPYSTIQKNGRPGIATEPLLLKEVQDIGRKWRDS
jgi:hypothetical protein